MKLKIYQIDTFTDTLFTGNPAAVCQLDNWPANQVMQNIAMENNLAETAFFVKKGDRFEIRWFTPKVEVDLCGHATLASAYVLFRFGNYPGDSIDFYSPRSGKLRVTREGDRLTVDLPTDIYEEVPLSAELSAGFDIPPTRAFKGKTDYMLVYENESQVKNIQTDLSKIALVKGRGVIITAKGDKVDFVSRFFAPQSGIDEDPVTGSAHTTLIPYWSKVFGKTELSAIQLSERKGYLQCKLLGERVEVSGQARLYMEGDIYTE